MEAGGFKTDRSLAAALTKLLRQYRQIQTDKEIPEQTIQAARTRVQESKYTAHFAYLCNVNPYWLAFGEGNIEIDSDPTKDGGWPFSFDRGKFDRLDEQQKKHIAAMIEGYIAACEDKNEPATKSRQRRVAG